MKDLMQDLTDAGRTAGAVALAMMIAAVVVFGVGCATHVDHVTGLDDTGRAVQWQRKAFSVRGMQPRKAKTWKPGKRCKVLGKALTTHVSVLVEHNCLKNGVTTVNMVVLNSEPKGKVKGGVAADHAVQALTSILGFKPKLKILLYGKTKGKVFFLTVVTGISGSATVANR